MQKISVSSKSSSNLFEFLKYKELAYFLVWREFKVKYRQTLLGVLWTILQPLMFAGILGFLLFSRGGFDFGIEGTSPIVVILVGYTFWQFFEGSISSAVGSLLKDQALIKKIYFPRTITIMSAISTRVIDFFINMTVVAVMLLVTGSDFNAVGFLYVIPMLIMLSLTSFGVGLMLAPLNLRFRDIQILIPFIMRIGFFTTPIFYPFSLVPEAIQRFLYINPVYSAVETTRLSFFTDQAVNTTGILTSVASMIVILCVGLIVFRSQEGKLADYV